MAIKNGTYRAKARTWALGETSKGTPEAAVEFIFTHPDMEGASITWHGYLSESTFDRTVEGLRHCGWTGDDLANMEGLDANEVDLVIENEEYEGKTRPKVRWVNKAGGLALKERMAPEKAKTFAASMRGRIRAADAAKGVKPANGGGKPAEPPPMDDSDIPF